MNKDLITKSKIIEAILFLSGNSVSFVDILNLLNISDCELNEIIQYLKKEYNENERGIFIKTFGQNIQMVTNEKYKDYIIQMLQPLQKQSLNTKSLETLAIIAYKQPITKNEIDAIRGVKSDYSIQSLLNKNLIYISGKKETIGNPNLYSTTDFFLSHFGIEQLSDLPALEDVKSEINT